MKVRNGEQVFSTFRKPLLAGIGLTLGAVPISARVIRDGLMAASRTSVQMAGESCPAAVPDGAQYLQLRPGQMSSVSLDEAVARDTNDVGHLEGGPFHLLSSFRDRLISSGLDTVIVSSGLAVALR